MPIKSSEHFVEHLPITTQQNHNKQTTMYHFNTNVYPIEETEFTPVVEIAPNCPRCASSNTKFCYYNNYSLSQPRYICKSCRRYWTRGGSLRNVPVGGGCRKNRRSKSLSKSRSQPPIIAQSPDSNELADGSNGDSDNGIDLAVVFANFLNQKPNRSDPDSVREKVSDDAGLLPITPSSGISSKTYSADQNEGIGAIEVDGFDSQSLLGDEHDVFWSDTTSTSFPWQPMMGEIQETEAFPSAVNPSIDNPSIDFYGLEVFSTS